MGPDHILSSDVSLQNCCENMLWWCEAPSHGMERIGGLTKGWMDEVSLRGRRQRAELSATLAHRLHVFLESQERVRYEDLRLELLQQEKAWAAEASNLERQLGNFGASHGTSHVMITEGTDEEIPMVWSTKTTESAKVGVSRRIEAQELTDAFRNHRHFGVCAMAKAAPDTANSQSDQSELLVLEPSTSNTVPTLPPAKPVNLDLLESTTDDGDYGSFRDFRGHLQLLLNARASVLGAERALATAEDFKAQEMREQLRQMPVTNTSMSMSSSMPKRIPESSRPNMSPESGREASSAPTKGLQDLQGSTLSSASMSSSSALISHTPDEVVNEGLGPSEATSVSQVGRLVQVAQLVQVTQRAKSVAKAAAGPLRDHLQGILRTPKPETEAVQVAAEAVTVTPAPTVASLPAPAEESSDKPLEIESFAQNFLQAAETKREKAALIEDPKEDRKQSQDLQRRSRSSLEVPGATHIDAPDGDSRDSQALDSENSEISSLQDELEPVEPVEPVDPAQLEHKMELWQSAGEYLRSSAESSNEIMTSTELLRRAQQVELKLEVDFARERLAALSTQRKALKSFWTSEDVLATDWLKHRLKSAEKARSFRTFETSGTKKSHLFNFMLCVEGIVAAYDAERKYLLDLPLNREEMDQVQGPLDALGREVTRSLRLISECRRLLETKVGARKREETSTSPAKSRVDDGRRSQWASVYADLLQVESKDSTTITLKTSSGLAWAKVWLAMSKRCYCMLLLLRLIWFECCIFRMHPILHTVWESTPSPTWSSDGSSGRSPVTDVSSLQPPAGCSRTGYSGLAPLRRKAPGAGALQPSLGWIFHGVLHIISGWISSWGRKSYEHLWTLAVFLRVQTHWWHGNWNHADSK